MCTVTYLPHKEGGYLLTSNRDEAPGRNAKSLHERQLGQARLIYPQDEGAGGTWVALSGAGVTVCILNGAREKHAHRPPYRRSRGLMALDYFAFSGPSAFAKAYTFEGMEPFTMVIAQRYALQVLRWDGQCTDLERLDTGQPHLWSSSTLYSPSVQQKREGWFRRWLAGAGAPRREDALHWHRTAGDGDPENDVVMNRGNQVRTVSITSVAVGQSSGDLAYFDLLGGLEKSVSIDFDHP
ncbi:NRDE family protein [Phaeodactylibacter luteus]|uniref:NRDE family protein n=1 Tax=Phaeodactylibacter luteus TaxID=1564516 RepID=A0A5C6RN76_9BACT|nr:NRDE family protein [Phaeodactylibacter luteus]TXB63355.1 hypothetical protein FRY97_09280 [Phaeodactylibacter luteus]